MRSTSTSLGKPSACRVRTSQYRLKEKVLAGHRSGLRTIILPKRNEQDLDDVPEEIKKSMKFQFAETVDEVLDFALEPVRKPKKTKATPKKKSTLKKAKVNAKNPTRRR